MFEITDNFLTSVGFDVTTMSSAEKEQYKQQFSSDITARVTAELFDELTPQQADEFNDIQSNQDRVYRWLDEFHADYRSRDDFQQILKNTGDNMDDATMFYAGILWMGDAVPEFGVIIQDVFDRYQAELIEGRQAANDIVAELE